MFVLSLFSIEFGEWTRLNLSLSKWEQHNGASERGHYGFLNVRRPISLMLQSSPVHLGQPTCLCLGGLMDVSRMISKRKDLMAFTKNIFRNNQAVEGEYGGFITDSLSVYGVWSTMLSLEYRLISSVCLPTVDILLFLEDTGDLTRLMKAGSKVNRTISFMPEPK